MKRPLSLALALLLLLPAGSAAAVVTRPAGSVLTAPAGSPAHAALARVAAAFPDLAARPPVDAGGGMNLLDASAWLAAVARGAGEGRADGEALQAIFAAEEALGEALASSGSRDVSLARACDALRARKAQDAAEHAKTASAKTPENARRDALETETRVENTVFLRAGTRRDTEGSDQIKARLSVADRAHGAQFTLVAQNPDKTGRHKTFVETLDHATAVPEARLTLTPPDLRGLSLDLGRYQESLGAGAFYSGHVDGVRAKIARGRAELTGSANVLASRFTDAGFGAFTTSGFDTTTLGLDWSIRGGTVGFHALKSGLVAAAGNATPVRTVSTAIYPARATAPLGDLSFRALRADVDLSRSLHAEGYVGVQDVEGYDPNGILGRTFQGIDMGGELVHRVEGEKTVLRGSMRAREADVFSLGRSDDFYDSEYHNDRFVSPVFSGAELTERLSNSVVARASVEHPFRQRWLRNPVDLRLAVETLDGWKDLDPASPGRQDGVYTQRAAVFHAAYRTPADWRLLTRVRGVLYDKDDADYRARTPFNAAPRDRAEFDLRLVSPAF